MKKILSAIALAGVLTGGAASVSAETYEVEKGDSLWDIAEEYDTTVDKLVEINDLKTTVIQPKQVLLVDETYTVSKGDTLIGIANKYGVSVEEIKEWNDLQSDIIVIGQTLTINGIETEKKMAKSKSNPGPSAKATTNAKENKAKESAKTESPEGKELTVTATAYTANCEGCTGVTYTGVDLKKQPNVKVIAVDPKVIPLGSEVYVEGYGYATAADIGSAIKGNRIDVYVPTEKEALNWGRRSVKVTIIE